MDEALDEKRRNAEFTAALDALEGSLEVPLVPGELENWVDAAREACVRLRLPLKMRCEGTHEDVLRSIASEDAGLLHRVERLREADRRLIEELDAIASRANELLEQTRGAEPDEQRVRAAAEAFSENALAFVIAVRKQEAALSTWLEESVNRDRGVVD